MHLVLVFLAMPYLVLSDCAGHCPFPYDINYCAVAYDNKDCGSTHWNINEGHVSWVGDSLNDRIDSVVVKPGCVFTGYADNQYHGDSHSYREWDGCHDLTDWFENDISSY